MKDFLAGLTLTLLLGVTLLPSPQVELLPFKPPPPPSTPATPPPEGLQFVTDPTITYDKETHVFKVTLPVNTVWACTVFRQTVPSYPLDDPNFPDGHYAPRHCWALEPNQQASYLDDWAYIDAYQGEWDVWVVLQVYETNPEGPYLDRETPRIRVTF